jgi:fused signal recognition particle receptor
MGTGYHGRLMNDSSETESEIAKAGGWWKRLSGGLGRTSSSLGSSISALVSNRRLDPETLDALEDELVRADFGQELAIRIVDDFGEGRYPTNLTPDEVKGVLAAEIEKVLEPVAKPLEIGARPFVILVAGVNGSGKTTTIGKLAARFRAEGRSVMLVAGDTFRAAAIDQLKIWAERTGASIMAREQGADAASLAFDAVTAAKAQNTEIVLVDTAGRLQNRAELMGELEKMVRVMRKVEPEAPHAVLLVLDATVGQNALQQVEIFGKTAGVTGLVMTKLDGTARGGILVAIASKFGLPVHFIGVGEGVEDLAPFTAHDFARAVVGLEK